MEQQGPEHVQEQVSFPSLSGLVCVCIRSLFDTDARSLFDTDARSRFDTDAREGSRCSLV
jgi:hypothetical protein